MPVSYNKINWDEGVPIFATALDTMDTGIDEVVEQSNDNVSRLDGAENNISNTLSSLNDLENALRPHNNNEHSDLFLPLDNLQVLDPSITTSGNRAENLTVSGFAVSFEIYFETVSGSDSIDCKILNRTLDGENAEWLNFTGLASGSSGEDRIFLGPLNFKNNYRIEVTAPSSKEYVFGYTIRYIEGDYFEN